ncbi:cytochrome P450 [Catellatospora coxensis]|uniref:Putative cytochrome P450 n=1 Tax=Catellatospora coxensis TaxID=310354 RepID=A0A8J3PAP2_9ACTN|nr:cytochrome P450 [Catellatospora coxensis]GIG09784.1 putative cytochrome P450 [Catellatospora coxensis]
MTEPSLFQEITDFGNRANPWPLYEKLRSRPVWQEADGTFVVGTFREIYSLLHDPRISSDPANLLPEYADKAGPLAQAGSSLPPSFIRTDPPRHDTLRRIAMRQFGPPHRPDRIEKLTPLLEDVVTKLIDGLADRQQCDLVDDFAYPFPVAAITGLLGVPPEDEPRFSQWVGPIVDSTGKDSPELTQRRTDAFQQLGMYMFQLAQSKRDNPGDDMLSGFVTDDGPDGRLEGGDLFSALILLLIAGHETTVNLIANGWLTLQRHPEVLQRLRTEPDLAIRMVEELLRYEGSVHFLPNRTAVADIEIGDTTIRKGHPIVLVLASGNRDTGCIPHADRFDPDRPDNVHLGFGNGIHYCFGAPLARLEAQLALTQLAKRLQNPRLVEDPPPYRPSPVLRGPIHLPVAYDAVLPA